MSKKWITAVLAAAMSMVMATAAFAGMWESQEDGFMKTGWYQNEAGVWYYLDENTGAMVSGTTRNIGGTNYTFDASGAWVEPPLSDGWNGQTFVNRSLGYQITLPDSYQAVSGENFSAPEGSVYDFVAAAPDGNSAILIASLDMSELDGMEWTDEDIADLMGYFFGSEGEVIGATFNDLGFAKLTLLQDEEVILDVYFRRCGSKILMIETMMIPSRWQEVDNILKTMKIPK